MASQGRINAAQLIAELPASRNDPLGSRRVEIFGILSQTRSVSAFLRGVISARPRFSGQVAGQSVEQRVTKDEGTDSRTPSY